MDVHDSTRTQASVIRRLTDPADQPTRDRAWSDFHARYAPVIAGFARRMGAADADAADVTQEVLLSFFQTGDRFVYDPAKGRFRGYLKTLTWRTLNRRREKARRPGQSGVAIDNVDPEHFSVENAWDELWRKEQLKHAIELVRLQYKDNATFRAFELHALHGKSVDETASASGLSVESVYKAKQRVTAALREQVLRLEEEEG